MSSFPEEGEGKIRSIRTKKCRFCGKPSGTRSFCCSAHKHKWLRRHSKKVIANQSYLNFRAYYFKGKYNPKRCPRARYKEYGVLLSFSYCLACGELLPFVLTEHHIFKRKDSEFSLTICWNCHKIGHRFPKDLARRIENFER